MTDLKAKAEIVGKFQRSEGDTGSSEVQVALITARITQLAEHLRTHRKDHHTRLGLLRLVGHRKRLLKYLKRTRPSAYVSLIEALGLRH
ncbi:MAG: 30S ribosomal protein S15 [Pseudomonadota bacterium]